MKVSDIAISGVAGRFPKSDNVVEFEKNLSDGVYMVGDTENRIKWKMPNHPTKFGLIRNLEKFDAQAFRTPPFVVKNMDPQGRILLEHVCEAILDAGVSPSSLMGSNTGVYVGCFNYDSLDYWLYDKTTRVGMSSVGNSPYAMANRISFALGLRGPSIAVDTACSSSTYALNYAFNDILHGNCDAAIVAGSNLILSPKPTEDFSTAGVLTKTGISQPFDKNASGYVRAEACSVVFLQKVANAKRVYATLVNVKVNNDGFKTEGPMVPSAEVQQQLYQSVYENLDIAAESVDYIEAHATSTQVGDKKEVASIDAFFCRKRTAPLKVGSVKSNIGHAEGAAGITSLVKCLLMFENGKFYPNLNIHELREDCPALVENRIEIVQNVGEFDGKLIGISSFGVNGSNAHALVQRNEKVKVNNGFPSDNFPRLLTWAGRTNEAVDTIFDHVASKSIDDEFLALLHSSQIKSNQTCMCRGFGIFQSNLEDHSTNVVDRQVQESEGVKRPIVFLFSGVGSQWQQMGKDLLKIPSVADKIEQCHQILLEKKINLKEILTSDDPKIFSNCLNIFVGVATVQIALTDLLRSIGVHADHFIGHSVGELACAYADETLTMEETILAAYSRGLAIVALKREPGAMAAIGLGYKELKNIIPESIEIACHNSSESCTISGKLEAVKKFVDEMKSKHVLAKIVDSAQIPFHSSYIAESGPLLLDRLKSIITMPKKRSHKWISTSIPKDQWDNELAQFSSAEYHTNNMLSPVLFEEGMLNLPDKSLIIEIAPHGLLQPIAKKCLPNCEYVSLTKRGVEDGVIFLLQSLGKIYQTGVDIDIRQIYPKIEFPVSRGTEMISPLIKWNHNENLFVPMHDPFTQSDKRCLHISLTDTKYNYLKGHSLGGRIILPATGYLCLVWETFAIMHCKDPEDLPVCFEEVKFLRATILAREHDTELTINIQRGTGKFEIIDGPTSVVSGKIKLAEDDEKLKTISMDQIDDKVQFSLDHSDFYKELSLRGYEYANDFKAVEDITRINNHQATGRIEWKSNWVTFIDCILQTVILSHDSRDLFLPTSIGKVIINPQSHREFIESSEVQNENETENGSPNPPADEENKKKKIILKLQSDFHLKTIRCGGVEIIGLVATFISKISQAIAPTLETYKFVPHFPTPTLSTLDAARFCVQLLLEISPMLKLNVVEVDDGAEALVESFVNCLDKVPMVMSDITYLTKKENIELASVKTCNDDDLKNFNCINILIMKNALKKSKEDLKLIFDKIDECGFLLSREELEEENLKVAEIYQCIAIITMERELIYVICKKQTISGEVIVKVPSGISNFEWIQKVKDEVYKKNVVLTSHSDGNFNGILGFSKCLCKEPNVKSLRCVLVEDDATDIEEHQFYRDQLDLCLPVNIFKNGKWGTYRHLSFSPNAHDMSPTKHSFVNLLTRGDVSSLKWIDGNLDVSSDNVISVHYGALNYRDVLIATKRIMLDYELENRIERQYLCGYEFSGVTKDGRRLMGLVKSKGIGNCISLDETLAIDVPSHWSLEEAATVPLVYLTVYLAFFEYTQIERGKSVLIHAGSGGVGIAAIRVALGYGLRVFTTVSTDEKKQYLLNEFPEFDPDDIGNTRDCTFETMVMTRTKGEGVNYVLNSLADDKMQASIRCLANNGVFLEVGKIDMLMGNTISLNHFLRGIQFKAVQFKVQELYGKESQARESLEKMEHDMKIGIIRPLRATVFAANEVEKAIRFMAASKHIGKILINVNEIKESTEENPLTPLQVLPRVYFDPSKSYIITGGLGGMGMEIADWMILRNCKKLVLSSSRGISSSYQTYRIKIWKSYDVEVVVSTANISTRKGCDELVKKAMELGPVGGILNLAGVISDGLFDKLDLESFDKVLKPKAFPAIYLDEVSRILCPALDHFVTFSSVSCGYGNAGQTNYAFANSFTEKVIEKRQRDGLPAKAVQWGPIDDVGMMKKVSEGKDLSSFFGMVPQKIHSCFDSMNDILSSTETIISSVVVAEKQKGFTNTKDFFTTIMTAMGIPDINSIDRNKPISALGMDSLGGTEIQQALEREFGISLTFQELRSKTLNELEILINGSNKNIKVQNMTSLMDSMWRNLHSGVGNGELIEQIKFVEGKKPKMLLIPGMIASLGSAWKGLDYSIYVLQHMKFYELKSFDELFNSIFGDVLELFKDEDEFILVGYSFGSAIALRICEIFESMGKSGKIIFVDGSPHYMKTSINEQIHSNNPTDSELQHFIFNELAIKTYGAMADEILRNVYSKSTWRQKVEEFTKSITDVQSKEFMEKNLESIFNRLRMVLKEEFNYKASANIKVLLIKPIDISSKISEDYGLRDYCDGSIRIESVPGDHYTLIDSKREIVDIVNSFLTR